MDAMIDKHPGQSFFCLQGQASSCVIRFSDPENMAITTCTRLVQNPGQSACNVVLVGIHLIHVLMTSLRKLSEAGAVTNSDQNKYKDNSSLCSICSHFFKPFSHSTSHIKLEIITYTPSNMGLIDKIEQKLSGSSKADKVENDQLSHTTSSNTTANQYGTATGTTHDPQSTLGSGAGGTTGTGHNHLSHTANSNTTSNQYGTATGATHDPQSTLSSVTGATSTGHPHHHHTGHASHVPGTTSSSGLAAGSQQPLSGQQSSGSFIPDRNASSGQALGGQTSQGQYVQGQGTPGQSLTGQQTTSHLPGQSVGSGHTSGHLTGQHGHHGQHGVAQTAGAGLAQHEVRKHEHGSAAQSFDPSASTQGTHHTGHHHHGHPQGGLTQAAEAGVAGGAIQHEVHRHEHGQHGGNIGQQGLQSQPGVTHQQPGSGIHEQTRSHVPSSVSGHGQSLGSTTGQDTRPLHQSTSQTGPGGVSSATSAAGGSTTGHHHGHHGHHGQHDQQRGAVGLVPNAENPSAIPTAGGQQIGAGAATGDTSVGPTSSTSATTNHGTGLQHDNTSSIHPAGSTTGVGHTSQGNTSSIHPAGSTTGTGQTSQGTTGGIGHDKLGEAYAAGYRHGSTNV